MVTHVTAFTGLTPPSRADDGAAFNGHADAWLGVFPTAQTQFNTVADEANANADRAAAAAVTAVNAPGTQASSTTSLAVGQGAKTLTIQTGKSIVPGLFVFIGRTSDPTGAWMLGGVTAYNSSTGALSVTVTNAVGAGTFTDWTVAISAPISFNPATVAQILAGATNNVAMTPLGFRNAQLPLALGDAATITGLDPAAGFNFTLTLGGNRTLPNPASMPLFQPFLIMVTQGTGGGFSLAYDSYYDFLSVGTPTLAPAAGAITILSCLVASPTKVIVSAFR